MKRIHRILFAVTILCMCFASCGKDPSDEDLTKKPTSGANHGGDGSGLPVITDSEGEDYFARVVMKKLPSEIRIPANNDEEIGTDLVAWLDFIDKEKSSNLNEILPPNNLFCKTYNHADWLSVSIVSRPYPWIVITGKPNHTGQERRETIELFCSHAANAVHLKFELVQNAKDEMTASEGSPFDETCTVNTNIYCGVTPLNTTDGVNVVGYQESGDRQTDHEMSLREQELAAIGNHVFSVSPSVPNGQTLSFEVMVYTKDGTKKTVKTVSTTHKTVFTPNVSQLLLTEGEKRTITCKKHTDCIFSWESENQSVATVNNGVVTAVASGNANIVISATNGEKTVQRKIPVMVKSVEDNVKISAGIYNILYPYVSVKNGLPETIDFSISVSIDGAPSKTYSLTLSPNQEDKIYPSMSFGTHTMSYTVRWTYKGKQYSKSDSHIITF